MTEKASEKERIQVEVAGAYDLNGKLDVNQLYNNIRDNIKDVNVTATTKEGGDDVFFPIKVTYNNSGHKYGVLEDGSVIENLIGAGEKAPSDSNALYTSENNIAVIPAGFTVSNSKEESSIETGLVIHDDEGNEFVWIPVGIAKRSIPTEIITLGRYIFDSEGTIDIQKSKTDGSSISVVNPFDSRFNVIEEGPRTTGSKQNAVAKNINDFIKKTNDAGGFWIGRYEARNKTKNGKNIVTENKNDNVYINITQPNASIVAKEMYVTNDYFESDLINSYAWDTAILFLQEYDTRIGSDLTKYSRQTRMEIDLSNTGTTTDKICNVYDMASNCYEFTTETSDFANNPCVYRGGGCSNIKNYTSARSWVSNNYTRDDFSFRPILYTK